MLTTTLVNLTAAHTPTYFQMFSWKILPAGVIQKAPNRHLQVGKLLRFPEIMKLSDVFQSVLACPQDCDLQLSESVTVFDSAPLAQGLVQSRCK